MGCTELQSFSLKRLNRIAKRLSLNNDVKDYDFLSQLSHAEILSVAVGVGLKGTHKVSFLDVQVILSWLVDSFGKYQ